MWCFRLIDSRIPIASHHATYRISMISPSILNSRLPPAIAIGMPNLSYTIPPIVAPINIIMPRSQPLSGPLDRLFRNVGFADRRR